MCSKSALTASNAARALRDKEELEQRLRTEARALKEGAALRI